MNGAFIFVICVLAYWGIFILLCVKCKMGWAAFLSLFLLSLEPLIIGLIFIYAIPLSPIKHGMVIPQVPFTVTGILIILSVICFKLAKRVTAPPDQNPSGFRWIWLVGGIVVQGIGVIFCLIFFYAPQILGSRISNPDLGVMTYLVVTTISVVLLYVASRMNTIQRPNIFRWVVFFLVVAFKNYTTIISLILIYALPAQPPVTYPLLAGFNIPIAY